MDERIEAFLRDVLSLEGENSNTVRVGVRKHLENCTKLYPDAERAQYRERVVEEMKRQKGTATAEHLRIALEVIDSTA